MNEKFTPAPWIYQDGDNFEKEAVITTEGRLDNCIVPICELDVYFDGDIGIEQAANVVLIATAPEMYAMLDKILNSAQPASDFYEEADALLAKARGEV